MSIKRDVTTLKEMPQEEFDLQIRTLEGIAYRYLEITKKEFLKAAKKVEYTKLNNEVSTISKITGLGMFFRCKLCMVVDTDVSVLRDRCKNCIWSNYTQDNHSACANHKTYRNMFGITSWKASKKAMRERALYLFRTIVKMKRERE